LDQDRGARDRACRTRARPTADRLPARGSVPVCRTRPHAVRPISRGCPDKPPTREINPERAASRVPLYQNSQTLTHAASAPLGHSLQKRTVVQWDMGVALGRDGGTDESTSPQLGITPISPDETSARVSAPDVQKSAA